MSEDDINESFISCSADEREHCELSLKSDPEAELSIGKLELGDEASPQEDPSPSTQKYPDSKYCSHPNVENTVVEESHENVVPDCVNGDASLVDKNVPEQSSTCDPNNQATATPESTSIKESNNHMHLEKKNNHTDTTDISQKTDNKITSPTADASLSPTAAMSNGFVLPSAEARMAVLSRLRTYEAKRRPYYQGKLASSLLYWRSVCEMMSISLEEMERIESLILGNIEMQKCMSEHCKGVVEDRIDVDGKLLDIKRARKLQDEKRTRYNHLATFWKSNSDQTTLSKLLGFTPPPFPTANDDEKKLSKHSSSILRSVLEFHTSSADRFTENAGLLREEAWLPLMTLRSKLEEQIGLMEKMGSVIMAQLESAENTIQQSWSHYYITEKACIAALRASGSSDSDVEDAWIAEMQYVMAVAYSKSYWLKSASRMAKLFSSIKETECQRRLFVRDILITYMKKQEILYLSIQSIVTPFLRDLVDLPLDRSSLEKAVHETIQLRAEELDRMSTKTIVIDESLSNAVIGQDINDDDDELAPPLLSELLCKANVIERRTSVLGWKTTLAISTADGFLHLFDLSSDLPVRSGSAAEVAFHALCPSIEIPSETSAKGSKTYDFGKKMIENLTPTETIKLRSAHITFNDMNGNSTFEVIETSEKNRTMFGKATTKKLTLRTISRAETVSWVAALRGAKVDWRHPWMT